MAGAGGGMQEMNTDLGLSVLHNNQKEWLGNSKEDDIPGKFKFEMAKEI